MKNKKLLSKAIQIATNAHNGQYDSTGLPYILHPLKVMSILNTIIILTYNYRYAI